MKVKIKKLSTDAVIPSYAKEGDAGMDLTATGIFINTKKGYIEYLTGLSVEIPEGYAGLVFPRSSISNVDLSLANSIGLIDSGYRGEIKVRFKRFENSIKNGYLDSYTIGDKVAQLVILPVPFITFVEADELSSTERGEGGFGHTNYAGEVAKSPLHYKHNE